MILDKQKSSTNQLDKWIFKFIIIGDSCVGKTSLINRYVEKRFEEDYKPTIGVSIVKTSVILEQIKSKVSLILWDMAAQEKYQKYRKFYFEGCVGALLVYDITRQSTFNNIKPKWYNDFKKYVGLKNSVFLLIGNKNDLEDERNVNKEDGKNLANEINAADFIETSAKNGDNVEKAFLRLIQKVLGNYEVAFQIE
ncbi:MAG: GTP-binding protein [Promethearchaeota archaeon]|nr:MAG: GTP-binding protein [Candidatus Lokiarchaeota archaeon]